MSVPTNKRKLLLPWAIAPGGLVSMLAVVSGFSRCVCAHISGPAHVTARELLDKYCARARRRGSNNLYELLLLPQVNLPSGSHPNSLLCSSPTSSDPFLSSSQMPLC